MVSKLIIFVIIVLINVILTVAVVVSIKIVVAVVTMRVTKAVTAKSVFHLIAWLAPITAFTAACTFHAETYQTM